MARRLMSALALTTALSAAFAVAAPAVAAEAPDAAAAGAPDAGDAAIVVTARRSSERLQDVPSSIQAVAGEQLQKLAITNVEEVSKIAPGLSLVSAGTSTSIVLRGVTWQPGSGTPATPIYINEVPFDPQQTLKSLFDVGQIEVLRGPQGTTRGAPSISGAVTIAYRKPDLTQFGGYVQALYGEANHLNVQGAINAPIIKDVLAIRIAGNFENSENSRIYSVNSTVKPKTEDRTIRATVLFKPTNTVTIQAMYQRRKTLLRWYDQVEGTGSPGFAALGIPANFNGPALSLKDRASVQDGPYVNREHTDLLTVNAAWQVLGHTLSYNFGRQWDRAAPTLISNDPTNILPGFEPYNSTSITVLPKWRTHELRLSSERNANRPFDYDIGWFSKHSDGPLGFTSPVFLPGAFGAPFQSVPGQVTTPNPRYVLTADTRIGIGQAFDSFYGNVRIHLGEKTELSGGVAFVKDRVPVTLDVTTSAASIAYANFLPAAFGGCPAPGFLPASPVYGPAYCEVTLPAGKFPTEAHNDKYTDTLYNFSISHKFTNDVMVYATTGTSFRTGLPAINNTGLPSDLLVPKPETATSYEIGVKTSFARKFRINAAVFQLNYKNQLTTFEGVNYLSNLPGQGLKTTSIAFYRNIDARVRGFELELGANPIENLSLNANITYSQTKSKGGLVPCNSATPLTPANPINFCPSVAGQVLNTTAPFQAVINGSYTVPVSDSLSGYFRFNVNVQGSNPNYGNFRTAGGVFRTAQSYALADLFAGLSGSKGWELGVYAKNVFNTQVELGRTLTPNTIFPLFAAPSGYDVVRTTTPREIGVTLRFAFGSR